VSLQRFRNKYHWIALVCTGLLLDCTSTCSGENPWWKWIEISGLITLALRIAHLVSVRFIVSSQKIKLI
jgi:hypothetical protein